MERQKTHNVGVKDDLLHHMCMVGHEKIYAMLEIVIKVCGWRKRKRKMSDVTVKAQTNDVQDGFELSSSLCPRAWIAMRSSSL